ncbi:MAG TPA: kelch repeat-containing protein [Candidatus Hydrogenedentes bacterium]|nr:kelch repeat-containing protein [Candidatus Hydrogenedentota bacterium]
MMKQLGMAVQIGLFLAVLIIAQPFGRATEIKHPTTIKQEYSWAQAPNVPWPPRYGHGTTVFDNKIWVMGGNNKRDGGMGVGDLNDVWYSENGIDWSQATQHAEWSPRVWAPALTFKDKLWVIGGLISISQEELNDVWYSQDGISWTQATANAVSPVRGWCATAVFLDKLWILGGIDNRNDVWCSDNGVEWVMIAAHAPWHGRFKHTAAVFDEMLWVLGGQYYDGFMVELNDVWCTPDGLNWTQITANAPWPQRISHTTTVHDNKLWVLGGQYDIGDELHGHTYFLNDVWCSSDGLNWTQVNDEAPWEVRSKHTSVAFANKLWVLGGYYPSGGYSRKDVWNLTISGIEGEGVSEGEGEACSGVCHSADQNHDGRINLSELLRVIQFYFISTYHCDLSGEDGYAPGPGDTLCAPHNSDFAPQDWAINLSELLRAIQIYNAGTYQSCLESEDGFCPGVGAD